MNRDDELESFLEPRRDEPDPQTRQAIWSRTARVLGRRRWVRRAGAVTALAACYVGGLLTMRFSLPPTVVEVERVVYQQVVDPPPEVTKAADVPKVEEKPATTLVVLSTVDLEWRALETLEKPLRARLYLLAGDRYLQEENDAASAARCYRLALEASPRQDWKLAPNDNWLLMAVKEAQQKEKANVRSNG